MLKQILKYILGYNEMSYFCNLRSKEIFFDLAAK